ncbi:MAG: serine acetyltransferase [Clostridia bacterium]|nr:serine acetyltransferase [Clostridia bacterium]
MENQEKKEKLGRVLCDLDSTLEWEYRYFRNRSVIIPNRKEIIVIIKSLQQLMFPDYFRLDINEGKTREEIIDATFDLMKRQITAAFSFSATESSVDTETLAYDILAELPDIKKMLIKDIQALYEGDPAARSAEEVILSYPGFYAVSIYRIANRFYRKGIPYIARVMTEFAHEKTGIDIHAGATIGEYFFIVHGTGIVIGETTTIGNHVKIYQGVTLGAKSFELDENGNPIKGVKRHPQIGDRVIIYAGATILGGNTYVGEGTVIGGNVWLTHSVEAGTTVTNSDSRRA